MKVLNKRGDNLGHTSVHVKIIGISRNYPDNVYMEYMSDSIPRKGERIKIENIPLEVVDVVWDINKNNIKAEIYIYDYNLQRKFKK